MCWLNWYKLSTMSIFISSQVSSLWLQVKIFDCKRVFVFLDILKVLSLRIPLNSESRIWSVLMFCTETAFTSNFSKVHLSIYNTEFWRPSSIPVKFNEPEFRYLKVVLMKWMFLTKVSENVWLSMYWTFVFLIIKLCRYCTCMKTWFGSPVRLPTSSISNDDVLEGRKTFKTAWCMWRRCSCSSSVEWISVLSRTTFLQLLIVTTLASSK